MSYYYTHKFYCGVNLFLIGERLWTEPIKFIDTVADGIKLSQPGHLTFPIMCENIDKNVFTVVSNIYEFSW